MSARARRFLRLESAVTFTLMFVGFRVAYSLAGFFWARGSKFSASRRSVTRFMLLRASLWLSLGSATEILADRIGLHRAASPSPARLA